MRGRTTRSLSPVGESSVLDERTLASLRNLSHEGEAGFLYKIIHRFIPSAQGAIDDMRAALEGRRAATAAQAARRLRADCLRLGAFALAECLQPLAFPGRGLSPARSLAQLRRVEHEFDRLKTALRWEVLLSPSAG